MNNLTPAVRITEAARAMNYYLLLADGQQAGPYSLDQLRIMSVKGAVPSDIHYWTEGMADWQPIRDLESLFNSPASVMPIRTGPLAVTPEFNSDQYEDSVPSSQKLRTTSESTTFDSTQAASKAGSKRRLQILAIFSPILVAVAGLFLLVAVDCKSSVPHQDRLRAAVPATLNATIASTAGPTSPGPARIATDNDEAANYRVRARLGDTKAARELGFLYFTGKGVPINFAEALNWLQIAADRGDAQAEDKIGIMHRNGWGVMKDYSQALRWFKKAADQSYPPSQCHIGCIYYYGQGVAKDEGLAETWFKLALPGLQNLANNGDEYAQGVLGNMYKWGLGVRKDYSQALTWFQKAADQGDAQAQANLGMMYVEGLGVAKDYGEALIWFQRAADHNDATAESALGFLFVHGLGVTKDYSQALGWFQKAADEGDAQAQANLGALYENGLGVTKDCGQALNWYQKAADQGYTPAQDAIRSLRTSIDQADSYQRDFKVAKDTHQLIVKGFFIGMSEEEVRNLIHSTYPQSFTRFGGDPGKMLYHHPEDTGIPGLQLAYGIEPTQFDFDKFGILIRFHWEADVVNRLFNVSDMDLDDFAQSIAENYSVPTLTSMTANDGSPYWKFVSSDGWEIYIFRDKSISVRKIPKPEQRGFN